MSTVLCFNDITLSPVIRDNTPWIRSAELARALAYKSEDAVSKIFSRNQDEFSNDMSLTVNLGVSGNPAVTTRIFSLRGCHLIAMFARTPVAKSFRRWVLDVLDQLAAEERALTSRETSADSLPPASITLTPSTPADRAPLLWSITAPEIVQA